MKNGTSRHADQPSLTLTIHQAAEHLSVSRWTIYRMLKAGQLKSVRVRGKKVVRRYDLERYVETGGRAGRK